MPQSEDTSVDLDFESESNSDSDVECVPNAKGSSKHSKSSSISSIRTTVKTGAINKSRPKNMSSSSSSVYNEKKTIEQIYQKKTQLEHILLRPDTYIGSVQAVESPMWVLNEESKLVLNQITYVPGFYKIFDEILVNAADNKIRDPSMDMLKVDIDAERNVISVMNNGKGIPIVIHKEEGVYVPELIFGHLLTSSNYNDDEKKVTGGRNGYGAKLCNIFSTEFIIETADRSTSQVYKQTFKKNMSERLTPRITENKKNDEYTKISFMPDLSKFNMDSLSPGILSLMQKRVYDMAGCLPGVRVFLNGERLKIRNFQQYVSLYAPDSHITHERVNERWEIALAVSSEGQFNHMSFVNSICTSKGGTHVDYITTQVVNKLQEAITKKVKGANLKPFHIKNMLWVFVNTLIENPTFDSQTKEQLTLRASAFGSKCVVSEELLKKFISKSGIMENLKTLALSKQEELLKKTDGRKTNRVSGIVKLDDANNAGTKKGADCTLILTEGDSAKTFAISGLSVVGRENYGVFPLRGKLLNVRDAQAKQTAENEEIENITKILGLQHKKIYGDVASLRYGRVMIMTDQDNDGSHIKGLLINLFDHFWPSLLKLQGFLCEFITPIVKCRKGNQVISFYTGPEYDRWRETTDLRGWQIKYYKGLGTSDAKEAKEYFSALGRHRKFYGQATDIDRELIDLAFSKKKADLRKQWLSSYVPGTFIEKTESTVPISDFINKELILFSMADNARSIPSAVDGLKPGQRKILFSAFKTKLRKEMKVLQFAGFVAGQSAYHHGEMSLCATIVNMAQDFVGSNNINLLLPKGQFGTRLAGGSDSASVRYINTMLSPVTRAIFHPEDDSVLTYLNDDGKNIEPEWYAPVIPMVLVNGAQGIGTGWSTTIPSYNPTDIIKNIRRKLDGENMEPMTPWYRGFTGTIEHVANGKFISSGIYEVVDEKTVRVYELPVTMWTDSFKAMLEDSIVKGKDIIKDYKQYSAEKNVDFELILTPEQMRKAEEETFEKRFKLTSSINTSNMVCFDEKGRIKKYESPLEILEEFYELRLTFYSKRKEFIVEKLLKEFQRLENKVRFIREVITRTLIIERKKKLIIVGELRSRNYLELSEKLIRAEGNQNSENAEDSDSEEDANKSKNFSEKTTESIRGYDYLLSMPLYSLTEEKISQLEAELAGKKGELEAIIKRTPEGLWRGDLCDLEEKIASYEEERLREELLDSQLVDKNRRRRAANASSSSSAAARKRPTKRPREDESDKVGKIDKDDSDFQKKPTQKRASTSNITNGTKVARKTEKKAKIESFFDSPTAEPTTLPVASKTSALNNDIFKFLQKSDDEDEDDDLAARIQKLRKKNRTNSAPSTGITAGATSITDDLLRKGSAATAAAVAKPAPQKNSAVRRKARIVEDSDEDESDQSLAFDISESENNFSDDDDENIGATLSQRPRRAAATRTAKTLESIVVSSDTGDTSEGNFEDDE